jgi:hypothetical protein
LEELSQFGWANTQWNNILRNALFLDGQAKVAIQEEAERGWAKRIRPTDLKRFNESHLTRVC